MSSPSLDPDQLTSSFWRRVDVVAETGSTNADLVARAGAGEDIDGAALLAESQTSGRGRHGRAWVSPPGAQIAMSVGVDVSRVPPDGWGWLALLTGVAVADAVQEVAGVPPGLKWPNDVLVSGGKLAGILAEVAGENTVVIGLGVNVSLTREQAPVDTATSLHMLGRDDVDRNRLAATILANLGHRIADWRTAGGAGPKLIDDYRALSVTLGSRVRALLPGDTEITGVATDLDTLGRLVIDDDGARHVIAAGDITHLRPQG